MCVRVASRLSHASLREKLCPIARSAMPLLWGIRKNGITLRTPGRKTSSEMDQPSLYRYAYDRSPSRVFTEAQWLTRAKGLFSALEPLGEVGQYIAASWTWERHLEAATVLPVGVEESAPPMPGVAVPLPARTAIGCPWCQHSHFTDRQGWIMPSASCGTYYTPYRGWELYGESKHDD